MGLSMAWWTDGLLGTEFIYVTPRSRRLVVFFNPDGTG